MMKLIFNLGILFFFSSSVFCQVGIGTDAPSPKAILEVSAGSAGNYKGFMPPRVPDDAAKRSITLDATDIGMMIYVEKTKRLEIWNGQNWQVSHQNSSSGYAKDLFISEYVEKGTGNNKAIEIANFTGKTVNLGEYAIYVNSNGGIPNGNNSAGNGGVNMTEVLLGDSDLAHGSVVVIKASTANEITIGMIGPVAFFDGNDSIILKKKGKGAPWIDIIGVPGVNWEFGKAVTLRRKAGFGPSRFYVPDQFEVFPEGTYSGLGSHTY